MNLGVAWVNAARPKTLIAAVLPVLASWVLAYRAPTLNDHLLLWVLGSVVCLQIATNFWNDYFDFRKGSDRDDRLGPRRLLQEKLATPGQVMFAALLFNVFSFLLAIPVFQERGWFLAGLGTVCLILSICYTGGPFPLAYLGLGELFVLIFFGWVATFFSFFVATGTWSLDASVLGIQVGLLSCALITINNLRDIEQDAKSQKNTLMVRLGEEVGFAVLCLELFIPYGINYYWHRHPKTSLVTLAAPLAILIFYRMQKRVKPNRQLAFASLHALLFLCLWSLGMFIS